MVAAESAVSRLPAARVRRGHHRRLRPPPAESAPAAARRRVRVHVVPPAAAYAPAPLREPRSVRPRDVARDHLVHADRQGAADPVTAKPVPWKTAFAINVLLW